MHWTERKRLRRMSLRTLKELRAEIDTATAEIQSLPERRDIDIAADFNGDPALVAEVKRIVGDKSKGQWRQLQKIFCRAEHCPDCPHGWYWYSYQSNKKTGKVIARFTGTPVLPPELTDKLMEKALKTKPVAYEFQDLAKKIPKKVPKDKSKK
jgi:hypothetical protein